MEQPDAALMAGVQIIFDPVAKTAILIRDEKMIAVPGRFDTYEAACVACLRVIRARYVDAYVRA